MISIHFSGKSLIAFSLILSLLAMTNPIGIANAAAIISQVTPVTPIGNDDTPDYTFSSDTAGAVINYNGGPCTSGTVFTVIGNNTITFDMLFENTYSTCQISVDDGMGISNLLPIPSFIIDTTPPSISINGLAVYNIPRGGGYSDSGAQWTDNVDPGNNWIPADGGIIVDTSATGTYNLTYTYVDTAGNTGSTSRTVNIITGGIPSITLSGSSPVNILIGNAYVDSGATAWDAEDGNLTSSIVTVNPVDVNVAGSYTITYNVSDSSSNPAPTISRTVNVVAGSIPSITLIGANPTYVEQGTSYTELGANANDLQDGDLSSSITISGTVDPNTAGTYILSYNVIDSNSNPAPTVTRDVIVADTIAPVITLSGASIININRGSPYNDAGASWTDLVDGSGMLVASGTVNTGTLGTYILTYDITDAAGNASITRTRTVNVVTGGIPVITLSGSSVVNILRGTTYTESGATALDTEDGSIAVTLTGSVDGNTLGAYTITYSTTDSNANTTIATRTVNVVTGGIPVITLSGSSIVDLALGETYTESGATALDTEDGDMTASMTISGSVDINTVGVYTITYRVIDSNLNSVSRTRTVNINDYIPPIITLLGSGNVIINAGSPYIDAGAIWTDNIDGSGMITPSGVVNINIAGLYMLSYNYTDTSGNTGSFVTRQVTVLALASVPLSIGPGGGGGGGSSYGMGLNSAPSQTVSNSSLSSNLLIPSIARLLQLSLVQDTNSASDSTTSDDTGLPIYTITEPITPYICPIVRELYAADDIGVSNVSEGEFTEDVQAMIMYRGIEGASNMENYSQRYLLNQSSGIIKNNEYFEGSRSITRAEFIKMLVRVLSCHYTASSAPSQFSDVGENAWYSEYINFAAEKGWVSGFADRTFHPHDLITRGEAAKILAKAIQLETGTTITGMPFTDVPESNGFAPYIYALRQNNIIGGKTNSYYDMNSNVSRNEVARIINKTFLSIE